MIWLSSSVALFVLAGLCEIGRRLAGVAVVA